MKLLFKNLLFTVVVPGTAAAYTPILIGESESMASGARFLLAIFAFFVGAVICGWCVWNFATTGRGTPAPFDAPRRLVVRGLYRHTRNPMYLGVLTVILGWVILFGTTDLVVYILVVATCFHLAIVLYEEPHLRQTFGQEYEEYCARVARWVPGPRRNV